VEDGRSLKDEVGGSPRAALIQRESVPKRCLSLAAQAHLLPRRHDRRNGHLLRRVDNARLPRRSLVHHLRLRGVHPLRLAGVSRRHRVRRAATSCGAAAKGMKCGVKSEG
jgi:hypothetical protein